jgi:dTMP kinase
MNPLRGKFIVFDGTEGCGKSTQANLLTERLISHGLPVLHVHDPGTTRIGKYIRELLLNPDNTDMSMRCEMLLYMAARAQMMSELILPALADNKVVISDRFVSSTLAYQVGGDALTPKDVRQVAEIATKGRSPDLTLILDIPLELSSARIDPQFVLPFPAGFRPRRDKDRIEQRPLEYHLRVRDRYLVQAKRDPEHFRVINADQTIEQVHQDVMRELNSLS